ncbi:MAG: hypothetical protein P8Y69_11310, partial [Gammaproteobacteria bacterium]
MRMTMRLAQFGMPNPGKMASATSTTIQPAMAYATASPELLPEARPRSLAHWVCTASGSWDWG